MHLKSIKVFVAILAWMGVVLAAFHQSDPAAVLGRYSWNYTYLLGLLIGVAATLSLAKSAWYLKLYQARAGIIVSAVSLLLSLGAVEVAIRILDPLGLSYYELIGQYSGDKLADDDLIFRHKPSWEKRYGDVLVIYNERGLRDRPILPKADAEFRILALGDSVTFGWGVAQDQTFAARLEPLLESYLQRPVRVINSGVCGYNTIQEMTYLKRDGIALQPDLVILTYVQNDIEVSGPFNPWAQPKSFMGMVRKRLGKLWSYRLVHHTYNYALHGHLKGPSVKPVQGDVGWRQSMSALSELVELCDKYKIPLIVFFQRTDRGESQPLLDDVVRHAHGVPVKDMAQWHDGLDMSLLVNSRVDGHPNGEGHRLIAEHMAGDIVSYMSTVR